MRKRHGLSRKLGAFGNEGALFHWRLNARGTGGQAVGIPYKVLTIFHGHFVSQ